MSKRLLLLSSLLVLLLLVTPQSPTIATSACPSGSGRIQLDNGLLTTVKDPTTAQNVFSTSGPCILYWPGSNNPAAIPQFSLTPYADMKSIYFNQHKSDTDKQTITSISQIDFAKPLYYIAGDLTITTKLNVPANKVGVVFVDGNLILAPANPGQSVIVSSDQSSGIVFVVGGDVRIGQTATEVDAVIITYGQFCSSWDGSGCSSYNNPLTIYGSVITLNSSKPPSFLRQNDSNDPDHPGELIIFEPKYLVILKDVFAKTLQIWSELTTEQ